MAVVLDGGSGLFDRVGALIASLNSINTYRGTTYAARVDALVALFASSEQAVVDGVYTALASFQNAFAGELAKLTSVGQATVIEMVHADHTLSQKTLPLALTELIAQMNDSSDTVDANAVAATPAADAGNVGDGYLAVSVLDNRGRTLEFALPETIEVKCTSDAQGNATEGQETFTIAGDVAVADRLSFEWPGGSGASGTMRAVDAAVESATQNLLTNGTFDTFTVANTPDDWIIAVGAAGTDIFSAGSSDDYTGDNGLELTGTGGAPLSEIYQTLDTDVINPLTVYAVHFKAKKSAGLLAGVLTVQLHDGTNPVDNAAGDDNSFTVAHGAVATSYGSHVGFFQTPKVLPAILRFRVKITTALTSGESLFIDHLCLTPARQLYTGGPYVALFSGVIPFIADDLFVVTVTNDFGGALQTGFHRFFNMVGLGLILPSAGAGAETISDAVVT